MEVFKGALGTVGSYELDIVAGQLLAKVGVKESVFSADLVVGLDAAAVLDLIAAKIPGTFDDALLGAAKAALLAAK